LSDSLNNTGYLIHVHPIKSSLIVAFSLSYILTIYAATIFLAARGPQGADADRAVREHQCL